MIISYQPSIKRKRLLIIGGGACGQLVTDEIEQRNLKYDIAGFVDDDPAKLHKPLAGSTVLGPVSDVPSLVEKLNIDEILIALPSVVGKPLQRIIEICEKTLAEIKIVPGIFDTIDYYTKKFAKAGSVRKLNYSDLLRRKPVLTEIEQVVSLVHQKTILITGAAGSIATGIVLELLKMSPKHLVLVDNSEYSLFRLLQRIDSNASPFSVLQGPNGRGITITPILGDVRNEQKMRSVFEQTRPHAVFHLAAYKHVPFMQRNPDEAITTNILGTMIVANLANEYGVERFVFVSTDKAAMPEGAMGASKRVAEHVILTMPQKQTRFLIVRFGNIIGSSGSLMPIWKKQMLHHGVIEVTHPEMKRFFMLRAEAVQLILQAATFDEGKIFILDMGEPFKIMDLAKAFIKLHGFEDADIKINVTQPRPGEKLEEVLLNSDESIMPTNNERISYAQPKQTPPREKVLAMVDALKTSLQKPNTELASLLMNTVKDLG